MAKKVEVITYRDAIIEIEEILERLNDADVDIDTVTLEVKRATELIALCKQRLAKSEQEIKSILTS